jgi:hypothetical protein
MNIRIYLTLLATILTYACAFAQTDSIPNQGTIKVMKHKSGPVFIKANAKFEAAGADSFQPFPVVEGFAFPFDYSKYFSQCFANISIDMKDKTNYTVYLQILVSKKGKVYLKDITYSDSEATYNTMSPLNVACLSFLNDIKKWFPAYTIDPEVGKFKGQTVIKPVKKNRDARGVISITFSTESFD